MHRIAAAVFRNVGSKLLAVLLAVFLWFLAAGQQRIETGYIVPVEFTNMPESVAIEGSPLEFIHVRVSGSRVQMERLTQEKIRTLLDLRAIKPGDNLIPVGERNITLPPDTRLVSVSPPYIMVKAAARRLVPIRVHLQGRPAEGYRLARTMVDPPSVAIIGAAVKVSQIKEIHMFPINVKGAAESLRAKADLISPDPEVRILELKPTEVRIDIEGLPTEGIVSPVPLVPPSASVRVMPASVSVLVRGPRNLVDDLEIGDIVAELEPVAGKAGAGIHRVRVTLPEGLTVVRVTPGTVAVTTNAEGQ
jgi:YbbR domain-containing protein